MDAWRQLTDPGSPALRDARLQVHYAAQLAAAPGKALAEPEPDYGHTALVWLPDAGALAGPRVPPGVRAGVRPADLTLVLLDDRGSGQAALPLDGATLAAGLDWLSGRLDGAELAPVRRDLPHHPVADGERFAVSDPAPFAEVTALFAGTTPLLEAHREGRPHASPVRCWPHHFDIATLDVLDPGLDPEEARSVGAGMTPGDEQFPDPYWYVTPWPYPAPDGLPALPAGSWHTEGWVGAVLPAAEVVAAPDQAALVGGFVRGATEAAAAALGAARR